MSTETPGAMAVTDTALSSLRTASGRFAMVALDQRESLREMFPAAAGPADDSALSAFKRTAAQVLSPYASGMLLDHPLGVLDRRPAEVDPGCGLILAADALDSHPGVGVQNSTLDPAVDRSLIRSVGAAAIKFLVIWRRGDRSYVPAVQSFLALAEDCGVASLVEGIVRPAPGHAWSSPRERDDAILEAASELSPRTSVYKAEVPGYAPGDLSQITQWSEQLSAAVEGPWVVLSNGVHQADFADAVSAACAGGASGFLAGRAIWADTVSEPDPSAALCSRSVARLRALTDIVEGSADPANPTKGARR